MELQLKHLSPYYQHGLKGIINNDGIVREVYSLCKHTIQTIPSKFGFTNCLIEYFKPLLLPLSALTEEIEFDGELFIPLEELFGINYSEWDGESETNPLCVAHTYNCSKGKVFPKYLPYWVIAQLIEWHFDIYCLIEQGLAIDKRTVKS